MNRRTMLMGGAVAAAVPAAALAATDAQPNGQPVLVAGIEPRREVFVFHSDRELTAKQHKVLKDKLRAQLGPEPIIITTCGGCSLRKL